MTKITFFELHLDGAEFTANAPGTGADEADEADVAVGATDESGGSPLIALLGLVVLVGVAVAVKKLLGGDSEPALDDLEE
jgi:hypothetical protein